MFNPPPPLHPSNTPSSNTPSSHPPPTHPPTMQILLTGSSGLIGHNVAEAAVRRGHKVIALYNNNKPDVPGLESTRQVDLSSIHNLTTIALEVFPDAIINAAAISSPALAKEKPEIAEKLNTQLPGRLAGIASHLSAKLIHISSGW